MDKGSLRKADLGTSLIIMAFGIWVLALAFDMPMKDSWGGVQNVWYVSPALFPLIVGGAITVLGLLLFRIALKSVGLAEAATLVRGLFRTAGDGGVLTEGNYRFLVITTLLFSFVYLTIPHVDFFLAALWFLVPFITIFYLAEAGAMSRLFRAYCAGTLVLLGFLATGLDAALADVAEYPADVLTLILVGLFIALARKTTACHAESRARLRTGLIVAFASPLGLGSVFKYFLLVPLPFEGMVVSVMDMIWYWEF